MLGCLYDLCIELYRFRVITGLGGDTDRNSYKLLYRVIMDSGLIRTRNSHVLFYLCMYVVLWGSSLSFMLTIYVYVSGTSGSKGKGRRDGTTLSPHHFMHLLILLL